MQQLPGAAAAAAAGVHAQHCGLTSLAPAFPSLTCAACLSLAAGSPCSRFACNLEAPACTLAGGLLVNLDFQCAHPSPRTALSPAASTQRPLHWQPAAPPCPPVHTAPPHAAPCSAVRRALSRPRTSGLLAPPGQGWPAPASQQRRHHHHHLLLRPQPPALPLAQQPPHRCPVLRLRRWLPRSAPAAPLMTAPVPAAQAPAARPAQLLTAHTAPAAAAMQPPPAAACGRKQRAG